MVSNESPASSPGGEVVVYEAPDGEVRVEARLEQETVWLSQRDMAAVFDTTPENVLMHLRNVFFSKELEAEATTKDFLVVRTEGRRQVRRRIRHYNLDAIISVGYRVNSRRGVRFRQWVTRTLREHLVRGFTVNERRLAERGLQEARETLDLLSRTLLNQALVDDTGQAVLELIGSYADTWRLLLEYDEDRLKTPPGAKLSTSALDHDRAVDAIVEFKRDLAARDEASTLFGNPRGDARQGLFRDVRADKQNPGLEPVAPPHTHTRPCCAQRNGRPRRRLRVVRQRHEQEKQNNDAKRHRRTPSMRSPPNLPRTGPPPIRMRRSGSGSGLEPDTIARPAAIDPHRLGRPAPIASRLHLRRGTAPIPP